MRRGLAILNMLIFVVVFSLLAAAMLGMMSSNTRQIETNVRRIRGWYAAESVNVLLADRLRLGQAIAGSYSIPWSFDPSTGAILSSVTVNVATNTPANAGAYWTGIANLNTTSDFSSVVW